MIQWLNSCYDDFQYINVCFWFESVHVSHLVIYHTPKLKWLDNARRRKDLFSYNKQKKKQSQKTRIANIFNTISSKLNLKMKILSLSIRSHVIRFLYFSLEHKRFPWNTIVSYTAMQSEYKARYAIVLGIRTNTVLIHSIWKMHASHFQKVSILTQGVYTSFVFRTHQ